MAFFGGVDDLKLKPCAGVDVEWLGLFLVIVPARNSGGEKESQEGCLGCSYGL